MNSTKPTAESAVLTLKIILGGLLMGVVSFATLAVFLVSSKSIAGERETPLLLALLGLVLALLAVGVGIILLLAQWPSEERYRRFAAATAGHDPT